MAKTRIVTPNTGSKRKKSCRTEAVGSSLDKTLTDYVNWDWFVSKLWPDQLWQTTFAGDLAVWRPHGVPTRSPVTTLLLWVHTVEDDLQEIVSFSQSAADWLCQQVQFDSKCFPLSNRLSIVLFTDGGSVTSERSTFWGLGRRTIIPRVSSLDEERRSDAVATWRCGRLRRFRRRDECCHIYSEVGVSGVQGSGGLHRGCWWSGGELGACWAGFCSVAFCNFIDCTLRHWNRTKCEKVEVFKSYNVTDAGIISQLWVSRLRADHQAFIEPKDQNSGVKGTPPRSAILITVVWPSRAVFTFIVFISLFRQDSCPSSLLLCLIVFLWCQCFVFVGYFLPNVWGKWDCDLSRRRCQ